MRQDQVSNKPNLNLRRFFESVGKDKKYYNEEKFKEIFKKYANKEKFSLWTVLLTLFIGLSIIMMSISLWYLFTYEFKTSYYYFVAATIILIFMTIGIYFHRISKLSTIYKFINKEY